MRTKNAKRLWPVPATLAVMAVAAFLAFGLLATTGAQPAAAQTDPDCTVANTGSVANDNPDTALIDNDLEDCSTSKTSAVVALEGALGLDDEDDLIVWVYAKGGSIAGGTTLTNVWDHTDSGSSTDTPKATRFSGVRLEIPEGVGGGIGGGGDKRQTVDITVTPASGNDDVELYVYYQAASPIPEADFDHDLTDTDASPDVLQIDPPTGGMLGSLTVTFLGSPAVGEDGPDLNNDVDDDEFEQCYLAADTSRMKVVLEEIACPGTHTEDEDIEDLAEIRSKLIAVSIVSGGNPINTPQVDGTTKTHKPAGQTSATVYAVIQDANGNPLKGSEVNFSATIEPQSVADTLDFDTDRDVNAKIVGDDGDAGEIDIASDAVGVEDDYAVAVREISGLPSNSPYKLTITVTVEGVPLGEIVIARDGAADKVLAAIFSAECFAAGGPVADPDYEAATFNMNDDDCEEIGMSGRFGHGQMVFIKSHIEDALDNIIGDGTDLDSELADEDDDLLGDGDPTLIEDPVDPDATDGDPARAWLYMIHEDATLGDHMITVSTDTKGEDDEGDEVDIDDVTLTVTVAGPPDMFGVEGPDVIALRGVEKYTVTATDAIGKAPYLTDTNNKVEIFIQDLPSGNARGLDSSSMLELDTETGEGTFTIFAPRDAMHGDVIRIFVGDATSADKEIMFGEEPPENVAPMAEGSIDDQMVDAGSYVMVDVSGAFSDADMDTLTYTAESDMMDYATAEVDDMGMVTITGVAAGMATITVTAMDDGGMSAMQTIDVTVNPANMAPMAEGSIADQMVYVGASVMVDVSGAFSDADMDTLTYTAESDMMDYATAEVDDMGMVTITGVAAGMATITVTAMDDGGMSAMQTIDVTVNPMPEPELGPAMDLTATANADGSVTLSWTPGTSATHHFVAGTDGAFSAADIAVWEFSSAMDTHTVSADLLTSGTEYDFYVISGQFEEQEDGSWPGVWASEGWAGPGMTVAN